LVEVIRTGDINLLSDLDFNAFTDSVHAKDHDRHLFTQLRACPYTTGRGNDLYGDLAEIDQDQVGIPALSSHDGILFVSGGVHTVTVRKEQRFHAVASLLHILHHEDERAAGITFVHRCHSLSGSSRYCCIRNLTRVFSDNHGRAARKHT